MDQGELVREKFTQAVKALGYIKVYSCATSATVPCNVHVTFIRFRDLFLPTAIPNNLQLNSANAVSLINSIRCFIIRATLSLGCFRDFKMVL